jgi:hypothetical protein
MKREAGQKAQRRRLASMREKLKLAIENAGWFLCRTPELRPAQIYSMT